MKKLKFTINVYGKRHYSLFSIFPLKKDGTRYKKPMLVEPTGLEKYQEEVLERVQKLNPNSKFELA